MKQITERFLKQINEKFYAAKNKDVNNRMRVSKFYDVKDISSSHYEDKMSTLAEIIKINAKRLHSLNPRYIALDPRLVLLKKIDGVFMSMGK